MQKFNIDVVFNAINVFGFLRIKTENTIFILIHIVFNKLKEA